MKRKMSKLILLDHESKEPLYMQLYRYFRTEIEQNNLKEDQKIPSYTYERNVR